MPNTSTLLWSCDHNWCEVISDILPLLRRTPFCVTYLICFIHHQMIILFPGQFYFYTGPILYITQYFHNMIVRSDRHKRTGMLLIIIMAINTLEQSPAKITLMKAGTPVIFAGCCWQWFTSVRHCIFYIDCTFLSLDASICEKGLL